MKKYLLIFFISLFYTSINAENITFMTYNLQRGSLTNWQSSRIDKLAQVIVSEGADVVAIQEIDSNSNFNNLKTKTGLQGTWYDIAGNNYGIGILWKGSLGTPTITNVKITPTIGSTDSESRAFIIAEFADFCFYSTHFSLNADDRDKMVEEMISRANAADKTVFVAGDFNAGPNYRAMLTLKSAGFNILNNDNDYTYPSSNPESMIDMLLGFRKNAADKYYTIVNRGIPTAPSGVTYSDISDHLPYVVTVDLQDANVHSLIVTTTEMNQAVEGSFLYCLAQATNDDVIEFNVNATEVTLPYTIAMKSITINGWNQYNNKRIVLKRNPSTNFFTLPAGISATLKNLILDGENLANGIGITTVNGSALILENCVLKNINSGAAKNNGGAMRVQGELNIKNCLFENNKTRLDEDYGGGAICIYNAANVTIENSSFIANKAARGGAVMTYGNNTYSLNAVNCTFANNEAAGLSNARGGAIYLQCPTATEVENNFINCTITGNYATNNGGGICMFPAANKKITLSLINSIILYNKTGTNSDIDFFSYYPDRINFQGINCIYGTNVKSGAGGLPVWDNSITFDYSEPKDVFDAIESDDFTRPTIFLENETKVAKLSSSSIAIDTGTSSVSGFTIPTIDQLGNTRFSNPDIGAVEYVSQQGNAIYNPANKNDLKLRQIGDRLFFEGLSEPTEMQLYNSDGSLITISRVSDSISFPLSGLQKGFYIIKIQKTTHKIILR